MKEDAITVEDFDTLSAEDTFDESSVFNEVTIMAFFTRLFANILAIAFLALVFAIKTWLLKPLIRIASKRFPTLHRHAEDEALPI